MSSDVLNVLRIRLPGVSVIVPNNLSAQSLMMVSLCPCALTPSAGETGDQDLVQPVVGPALRVKYPHITRGGGCVYPPTHTVQRVGSHRLSFSQRSQGGRGRGSLGTPVWVAAHCCGVLIWSARQAAAHSPSRDGAVFVLRVCKLAVIRLLSNDVGELIRAVLMGALISLWCVMLMRL